MKETNGSEPTELIPPISITAPPESGTTGSLGDDPPFGVPAAVGTGIVGVMVISLLAWWRIRKAEDDDD